MQNIINIILDQLNGFDQISLNGILGHLVINRKDDCADHE